MGFALKFKCIFCYDFISIFFIGTQYMIHDGKNLCNEKNYNKNFNHQIFMDFLNDQIWAFFSKVPILVIFC